MMSAESPVFTAKDRARIRLQFMNRFGSATSIHECFWLRRWASGPRKGEPKIPPVVQSMIERGLVRIVDDGRGLPLVRFTYAGLRALAEMGNDARSFQPPERYSSLLAEIGSLRRFSGEMTGSPAFWEQTGPRAIGIIVHDGIS